MIEIKAVGGYNEIGRNMTAIKVDDDVIILDMGIHLENYIKYTEDEDIVIVDPQKMIEENAVPNISTIEKWRKDVRVIIPTHAHLDHVGAVPFLGNNFDAPILCTHFTAEVLKRILKDENIRLKNKIKTLSTNAIYYVSKDLKIEFINTTHSTPQTVMVAVHTKYGTILYANDFKFDLYPTLGRKPNLARLKELGKKTILALIVESTYAKEAKKTPSESVARGMLRDVLLNINSRKKAIIVTTFSSHLARLKSIIEFGKKIKRKVIFLGRSLGKYVYAGERTGIINFSKDVELVNYGSKIRKRLKRITKNKGKYLLVVTGHQGEPKATLAKMARGEFPFDFEAEDNVIFSCMTIPTPTNKENRRNLEEQLKRFKVRIFKDIHVSGHAAREDLRELIRMVEPKHIIPAHGSGSMTKALAELAEEMDHKPENIHLLKDGQSVKL